MRRDLCRDSIVQVISMLATKKQSRVYTIFQMKCKNSPLYKVPLPSPPSSSDKKKQHPLLVYFLVYHARAGPQKQASGYSPKAAESRILREAMRSTKIIDP